MSEPELSPTAERAQTLLGQVGALLDELRSLPWAAVAGDELVSVLQAGEVVARTLLAAQVAQVAELDRRGVAAAHGCPSTAALLRQMLRLTGAEARSRVRAARAVHDRLQPSGATAPPELPVLRAAVDAGRLDRAHVDTVIATLTALPDRVGSAVRAEAERTLVGYAVELEPDQFRKVAAHLAEVLDPDGGLDQQEAFARAELHIGMRNPATGLTPVTGRLDDLSVETLRVAVDGLAAPAPAVDGVRDTRPAATRRAHALVEVLRRALSVAELPTHGGRRPQVAVTLSWDVLRDRIGTAVTDGGATLTPATARRLLCDADVIPAVLGGDGQVLDLGRATRTFSPALRHAITLRDRGCAFPGCDRPPSWTDVHHVRFWSRDLGDTSYANGCLLCAHHHTEIHRGHWRAHMGADGVPEFVPPRWIDPDRRPRRNTLHHLAPDPVPG